MKKPGTIHREDGRYYIPADVPMDGIQDYALKLIYHLLEQERPNRFPPHNGSNFFFGSTTHSMNRRHRVTVEIPIDEYEIVAAPWEPAKDLFLETMQEFGFAESCSVEHLHELVESYWRDAFCVESCNEIESGYEYYVPNPIPSKLIREIESI